MGLWGLGSGGRRCWVRFCRARWRCSWAARAGEEFLNLVCVCLYWDSLSFEIIGELVYFGGVSGDECFKGIPESFLNFRSLEAVGVKG